MPPETVKLNEPRWLRLPALAVLAAVVCFWAGTVARGASLTASLDQATISLGESAELTLSFEGGAPGGALAFPPIPGLRIVDVNQTSQSVTIISGQVTATESRVYEVTPTQAGEFVIPALSANINGAVVSTQPLKLTVLKSAAAAGSQLVFLKLVLPKTQVYVGEALQTESQLWLRDGVLGLRDFQWTPLQAEGFTVGKMVEGQRRQTSAAGVNYTVIPVSMAIMAAKAGNLTLGPVECHATLLLPPVNFFGQPTRAQAVNPGSEPVSVQALPLPAEHVPPGFTGAVGNYSLQVEVTPTNVAVGDPITVKVHISGRGALESVTLPEQPGWQHFKVYPPTSDFQPAPNDPLGITGVKNFALTVVPETMDLRELPAFAFSYFDPDQKRYVTLAQPAVPLTVRPSAASLPPPVLSNVASAPEAAPPAGAGLAPLKPRLGALGEIEPPLVMRPWFLAAQSVPVVLWLTLLAGRKQKERLAQNPRLRRQREVEQAVRAGLKTLRHAATANDRETFFATAFRLLQERLGERLDLPAAAITEAAVDERLAAGALPAEARATLHELFQSCDQARYARLGPGEELLSMLPRVESALDELGKITA